jgi:hypothetical protein
MHRDQLIDKDLVIAVGGDGTVLNSASFLNDKIPLLGEGLSAIMRQLIIDLNYHCTLTLLLVCNISFVQLNNLIGVNSDPTRDDEGSVTKVVDERRSKGALCASSAVNVHSTLPLFLSGSIPPQIRTRIRCVVKRYIALILCH